MAVRVCAARYYNLPLFATHVWFLVLILTAITVRMADLAVIPCIFTVDDDGAVMSNVLANTPLMLMFTIFTMLLYHTFVVVHSIHLSYDQNATIPQVLSSGSVPAGRGQAAATGTAAPRMPSISSLMHSGTLLGPTGQSIAPMHRPACRRW